VTIASRPSWWDETKSLYPCFYMVVKRDFGKSEITERRHDADWRDFDFGSLYSDFGRQQQMERYEWEAHSTPPSTKPIAR
jgi:hypothetical protein